MDGSTIVLMLFGWGAFLFALYFVVTAAVAEGMKRHTRWQVANRDAIEEKYAQRPEG